MSNSSTNESSIRKEVVEVWQDTVETKSAGESDNFFHVGGDSMRAIYMLVELRAKLGVAIEVEEFLACPTLGSLILIASKSSSVPD